MPVRKANAVWQGTFKEGKGTMNLSSIDFAYSAASRFEEGPGSNPEELIAAAHAGCYSMAFNLNLERAGFAAKKVETTANVHLEKTDAGQTVTRIVLETAAEVPGIDEAQFQELATKTKDTCPISRLLAAAQITVNARLVR
jgi:osmotically inducible protein OsmC